MIFAFAFVTWLLFVEFKTTGGRHTPALYFLLFMTCLMTICTLLSNQTPFSEAGFFFLALITGAFWIGHLSAAMALGLPNKAFYPGDNYDSELDRLLTLPAVFKSMRLLAAIGAMAGVAALILLFLAATGAGVQVSSFSDLGFLPAFFSAARYSTGGGEVEPGSIRLLMVLIEAGSVAGGLLQSTSSRNQKRVIQFAPLGIAFLMTLVTGARSYFFLNIVWFFGSLIAVQCVRGQIFKQLRSTFFLVRSSLLLLIGFIFGSAFSLLRYASQNLVAPTLDQFVAQLVPTMASSLASIVTATIIFDQVINPAGVPMHFGAYTFAPPLAWLGLESIRYPPTVYLTNGLSDSNQYSLTGFLLMDFGPYITFIIYFMTGSLAATAVHLVRAGFVVAFPLVVAIICVILFSPFHNFFFFTTHVVLFIAMSAVSFFMLRYRRKIAG